MEGVGEGWSDREEEVRRGGGECMRDGGWERREEVRGRGGKQLWGSRGWMAGRG